MGWTLVSGKRNLAREGARTKTLTSTLRGPERWPGPHSVPAALHGLCKEIPHPSPLGGAS